MHVCVCVCYLSAGMSLRGGPEGWGKSCGLSFLAVQLVMALGCYQG